MIAQGLDEQIRAGWLTYAWRVVSADDKHISECRRRFGSPDAAQRHAPPWMRWPGYIGARWRPGHGLLFVGSVHREFDVGRTKLQEPVLRALEERLIDANRAWRESGRSDLADDAYLTCTQEAFALMWQQWPRSRVFDRFVGAFGLSADQVAWTNLAKCQVFLKDRLTGRPFADRQEHLQTLCQTPFPIAETIELLQPRATFVPVLRVGDRTRLPQEARMLVYDGRTGVRNGEGPSIWAGREIARMLLEGIRHKDSTVITEIGEVHPDSAVPR